MNHYTLTICGFTRQLPIIKVGPKLSLASFSILGDVELVDVLAHELVDRIKYLKFDYLIGTETKILPLVYQMSRLLGNKNYIVVRQRIRGYMVQPIKSPGKKPLVLNGPDAQLLKNKHVIIVTDVVSSGRTAHQVIKLLGQINAQVTAVTSVLKQGELKQPLSTPHFYLQTLPLFT